MKLNRLTQKIRLTDWPCEFLSFSKTNFKAYPICEWIELKTCLQLVQVSFLYIKTIFKSTLFLAIAEVYNNEGNEAYRKKDYNNAVYFYTEGIKVQCKDIDLKAELYGNRADAHLRLGEATFVL